MYLADGDPEIAALDAERRLAKGGVDEARWLRVSLRLHWFDSVTKYPVRALCGFTAYKTTPRVHALEGPVYCADCVELLRKQRSE